jgi:hypothetical protein
MFKEKRKKKLLAKYYTDIKEMPIMNWFSLYEQNNLSYLLKDKRDKLDHVANTAIEMIQEQVIDNFGISKNYHRVLNNKIRIEMMYLRQVTTKDKSNQLQINILEAENEKLQGNFSTEGMFASIVGIEKQMGFKLDPFKTTIFEFYNYAKYLTDGK